MALILLSPKLLVKPTTICRLSDRKTHLAYAGTARVAKCRFVPLAKPDYTWTEHLLAINFWLSFGTLTTLKMVKELREADCPHCHTRTNWWKSFSLAYTISFAPC